jgi:hypothetical protein
MHSSKMDPSNEDLFIQSSSNAVPDAGDAVPIEALTPLETDEQWDENKPYLVEKWINRDETAQKIYDDLKEEKKLLAKEYVLLIP